MSTEKRADLWNGLVDVYICIRGHKILLFYGKKARPLGVLHSIEMTGLLCLSSEKEGFL